ncbi:branched-chain amino acid ABC transporter ATP-binding protein/permease [Aminobacter aminovorans]|uniref:ABC transporter ATP-binding protein n=1 Tax=Aminobacter aminovorans TaxID=83263 RepID=A0AAC8YW00_AMIAI|nr:branched-chain amino acid ABC transporter ATP-binding protein/permease [Aminobacter aminovorans]AMS45490.1 ABC transporter ATP-binding protein [Aminobacter aminovorans]MBB3708698.1 branched-chain amino acid transport system permease protein [Aminobacter aminovorans]
MSRVVLLSVLVVLVVLGLSLPAYYLNVLNYVGLYGLVALGVVLLTGVAGVTSFGQAAFVGLGAYTTAVATIHFELSPWIGLLLAVGLSAAAAWFIGMITLRLSGHYLPLSTMAWGLSAYYLFGTIEMLGGHTGISGVPPISVGGFELTSQMAIFGLIWVALLLALVLSANLLESRIGRAMRSIKTARQTAESFGIDTSKLRLVIFVYASILAALSGWLYAHMLRFVNPSPFDLPASIEYLFMVVVGGASSLWGAVIGAAALTGLQEFLQGALPGIIGQAGQYETIVFGLLIIVLLQFNGERGVSGWLFKQVQPKSYALQTQDGELPRRARDAARADGGPLLRLRGIGKSFGGLRALKAVSFDVGQKEIVSIIGPNGAGKSTLFNCITGVLRPDEGELFLRDKEISTQNVRKFVQKGVARTFQHVKLVSGMSVLENTMLGAHIRVAGGTISAALHLERDQEKQLRAEAMKQLKRVGLDNVQHMDAASLSLGQQRLIEIARALCADPEILLLDEPAAGLRQLEKQKLASLLQDLREDGLSILLVEHDMGFVMGLSNRIVVINYGEKLVEGDPANVRTDPRVIQAYLGTAA